MVNSLTDTFTLSNGVKIPCIGFGTWEAADGDVAVSSVLSAIEAGYRHIDTAAAYGNEASVGEAIRRSGVPREELFITSKLRNPEHGYESTLRAFADTLQRLGTDYLDLYLIHWPNPKVFRPNYKAHNLATWRAFEELYKAGKIRAIGISNFLPHHMDALLPEAEIKPMVNQIEIHPGLNREEVIPYCKEHGILLEAYSPFSRGALLEHPVLKEIAGKYGKSTAQVCLRWNLQHGYVPLPKSVHEERIRSNADVFDFALTEADMAKLDGMPPCARNSPHPDTVDF